MKTFLILLASILCAASAFGQTLEVTGTVKDLQGRPIPDVIVKAEVGKRSLAYTVTNRQGAYTLRFGWKKGTMLVFSHVAYEETLSPCLPHNGEGDHAGSLSSGNKSDGSPLPITGEGQGERVWKSVLDMVLIPRTIALREVKVKAPPLRLMGDTLSYNLASFLGKGDVTLADGLKRLPGIEVSGTGAIRYMGRPISKFYIEGLDMLGGKYNLATKNIPAEYTSQVQVLRHHKAKKIDADEESADVALNVKLTKKAKFKPFGEPILGIGWREDEPLYAAGMTGMMFTDDFQTIASAKGSNHAGFGSYDMIDHFGNSTVSALALNKLPRWSGGQPPVGEHLYLTNAYGSLNGILRLDNTRQVRATAHYTYEEQHNTFSTQTT